MRQKFKKQEGITLIALVVTIIVLLILAGISISMLAGDNSIIEQATTAKTKTEQASEIEQIALAILTEQTNNLGSASTESGLQEALDSNGTNAIAAVEGSGYRIKFNNTEREYVIDTSGNVKKIYDPKQENLPETEAVKNYAEWTKLNKVSKLGGFDSSTGVNAPKLGSELTAVTLTSDISSYEADGTWYDYVAQTTTTENGGTSKWANAVTTDSNGDVTGYYVWIPRYAYKITSGYHKSGAELNTSDATKGAGTIEIKFLKGTTNEFADGTGTAETDPSKITDVANQWLVHPAFLSDANIGGGFGSKSGSSDGVTGIWVAKFEASAFVGTNAKSSRQLGSIAAEQTVRLASLPEIQATAGLTIGKMYELSLKANSNAESHMLKNSEWGAVAYLAHSEYGRNGTEVTINDDDDGYTGGSDGSKNYIDSDHVKQSTTGNAYGIYDMNGGNWEYVASYVNNGGYGLTAYGGEMTSTVAKSTKYKTVYQSTSSTGSYSPQIQSYDYELSKAIKGDAIYETSHGCSGSTDTWFADYSNFPNGEYSFFIRGGGYTYDTAAGLFYFYDGDGCSYIGDGFRVALVVG